MAENKKKLKEKQGLKNKEAVEFMLVNRGVDDPNYRKDNVSDKILLLVPKDKVDEKTKTLHDEIIAKIPQINRGVYSDDHVKGELTKFAKSEENVELKPEEKKVVINLVNNKVYEFDKNEKNPKVVEVNTKQEEKADIKIETKEELINLDDKKIDEIFKRVKLPSDVKMVEYNAFGLPKDTDPEIYNYITNKEFKEGVDEFIPASRNIPVNNYDIDIKPEEMDEEHKDLFDAIEQKYEGYEELEDNFVIIANEGKIPINLIENPEILKEEVKNQEEMVMTNKFDTKKKPKYITEEEREYLNKKFNHCFENEYKNKESADNREKVNENTLNDAIDELICKNNKPQKKEINEDEEEDFEEYEYDEEEEEDYEDYENEDEDEEEDDENDIESIRKANEGKIKIEYIEKKKPKLKPVKKEKGKDDINEDFEKMFNDKEMIIGTVDLMEHQTSDKEDEDEVADYYMKKPKIYENIETNHSTISKSNQPKIIPATFKKQNKNEITVSKAEKKAIMENIDKDRNKEISVKSSKTEKVSEKIQKANKIDDNETKEQKALRKKLLKEEKKQKRIKKKHLKEAYTQEKIKQMKNIATMNQSLSFGVSVKEI